MASKLKFLKKTRSRKSGFTMIEQLIVMAIIAVITAFATANYNSGNRQVVLDMQINEFAQNLRKMQEWSFAAHEVPVDGGTGYSSMPGYGVYLSQAASEEGISSYWTYTDNDNDKKYTAGFDSIQSTVYLDKRLEISSSPNPASINFIPPDPMTKITDHSSGDQSIAVAEVTFKIKETSISRKVKINRAGLVYVE